MKAIEFTQEELQNIKNLYIEQNKTCKELACMYNISFVSMQKVLKQNNIFKKHEDKTYLSWLLNDENMSYEQMADFLNVSVKTVRANLKANGLIKSTTKKTTLTTPNTPLKEAIRSNQYVDLHAAKEEYMLKFIPLLQEKLSSCDSKIRLSVIDNCGDQIAIFEDKFIVDFIIPEVNMGYVLTAETPNANKNSISFNKQNEIIFRHNFGSDHVYTLRRYDHLTHYSDIDAMKDVVNRLVENLINSKNLRNKI